ncbi:MAG: response regulator [Deltaproteobacteria bacterium]|nr:response regulator [Deltaproteobacteria bacterium]
MKVLIVEDEFVSRKLMQKILSPYANCDVAVDGEEAIQAFKIAWEEKEPYDLICMDIMMPKMDGKQALKKIREMETEMGIKASDEVKIIMTTALAEQKDVEETLKEGVSWYLVKPITKQKLLEQLRKLALI